MTIMVCAVLLAVSAFFYAPMEVSAKTSLLTSTLLTPNENYVTTGYGMTSYIYAGSEIEFYGSGTFSVIDGQNLYYEDLISAKIDFATLNNGSAVTFNGDMGRIFGNVQIRPNSVIGTDSTYPGLELIFEEHIKEVYYLINGRKYYGSLVSRSTTSNTYIYQFNFTFDIPFPGFTLTDYNTSLNVVTTNYVGIDAFDVDITAGHTMMHWTVQPSSVFNFYNGSTASPQGSIRVYDYNSESVTDIDVEIQTDEMQQATEQQTETMVNGFDNTQGDNVNADLSAGLNEYQTAEDSLFATATTGMKDFTFFDIESVPAMVTGISFITATMTGWFNQAGGASGVGIVLSILFSVMLVAMVLGLYRWYQSKGGKD